MACASDSTCRKTFAGAGAGRLCCIPKASRSGFWFPVVAKVAFICQSLSGEIKARTPKGRAVEVRSPSQSTGQAAAMRSEEHTSELQSLMRISYAVFCLKKKKL